MINITVTPLLVFVALYIVIAIAVAFAGIVEQMKFANPSYGEVIITGVLWIFLLLQIIYYKVTGRYLINDIKKLRKENSFS